MYSINLKKILPSEIATCNSHPWREGSMISRHKIGILFIFLKFAINRTENSSSIGDSPRQPTTPCPVACGVVASSPGSVQSSQINSATARTQWMRLRAQVARFSVVRQLASPRLSFWCRTRDGDQWRPVKCFAIANSNTQQQQQQQDQQPFMAQTDNVITYLSLIHI